METGDLAPDKEKQQIRNKIAALKKQYSREILDNKSNIICKMLVEMREFREAGTVAAYFSLPDEVQTL